VRNVERTAAWAAFLALAAALVALLGGWFDPPESKVASATRKCAWAMGVGMIKDAEGYCKTAIDISAGPHKISSLVLARANTQAAALAIHELRVDEAVDYCRKAIRAWAGVTQHYDEKEKAESANACEVLIAAAKRRTPSRRL
jgi:hypothetical protein